MRLIPAPATIFLAGLLSLLCTAATAAADYLSFATEDEANSTEIFSKASPAVVFVTNKTLRQDFFSLDIHEIPRGNGSGFVWDKSGLIVTNFHVIAGAHRVTVTLHDQQEYAAEVVGIAPEKDLAVLRISEPPKDLVTLPIGDSSELNVGRKVLAIGNPFGLDTTLTTGVVSALGREIKAPSNRTIRGVIQTDAAINPGNSGGPLLNSLGQLVGVNTAIYSPSGASAGIGFAIPVNTVRDVVPQLIAYGKILRPSLGIERASDRWIRRNRIQGLPVVRVFPGSPAAAAGIRGAYRNARGEIMLGDVITRIGDREIRSNDDFLSVLEQHEPGDSLTLELRRGRDKRLATVTLADSH
ncbi:trypsin-like peptidase domain-containing protein [Parahaliea sp. F7430]|uniref:Trypsin-like peptidase domain-containing protein n=1 Tax=Sediminihaliea albiluteola TaxID=2758564 RepID=A0A7W2YIV1_9GAMM|nr:trypsin-like peptidase domain-containing protein [Sediminihaliea albiluteola]MBA6412896.1 trypsin-like peptidase domain-containing protein [Sediminihaliea albiluteola]